MAHISYFLMNRTTMSLIILIGMFCIFVQANLTTNEIPTESNAHFTEFNNTANVTKIEFNPSGLGGFYDLSLKFMDLVVPKDVFPEGFLKIENGQVTVNEKDEVNALTRKYPKLLALVIILLIITTFIPLGGLCFCCYRWCCSTKDFSGQKHDFSKKIVFSVIIIICCTLLLFGVACTFASNEKMEQGIKDLPENLRKGIQDTNNYIQETNDQINVLLVDNFQEFKNLFVQTIKDMSDMILHEIQIRLKLDMLNGLEKVMEKFPVIQEDLDNLNKLRATLIDSAIKLKIEMNEVTTQLLEILDKCPSEDCKNLKKTVKSLPSVPNFENLPTISDKIEKFKQINANNIIKILGTCKTQLENVLHKIKNIVEENTEQMTIQLNNTNENMKESSEKITEVIVKFRELLNNVSKMGIDQSEIYIKEYSKYRYNFSLVISSILLFICLLVIFGLVFGFCIQRPNGRNCCNKKIGGYFLFSEVILIFIVTLFVGIVVLVGLFVGITSQRVICDPIGYPKNSKVFKYVDKLVNSSSYGDFNVSNVLINCYDSKSIYEVFNLKNKFDLDEMEKKLNIDEIVEELTNTLTETAKNFRILNEDDFKIIVDLQKNSQFFNIDFKQFKSILINALGFDLEEFSMNLTESVKKIDEPYSTELDKQREKVDLVQKNTIEPMKEKTKTILNLIDKLSDDLKGDNMALNYLITNLIVDLDNANRSIYELTEKIEQVIKQDIVVQVNKYVRRIKIKTENDLGRCGPLSVVIHNTLTATCEKILLPWNGFWFALFLILLTFIPIIFTSVALEKLYKKPKLENDEEKKIMKEVDKVNNEGLPMENNIMSDVTNSTVTSEE